MEFYLIQNNGDFTKPITYNYLNVDGFSIENKYILDQVESFSKDSLIVVQEETKQQIDYDYNSSDNLNQNVVNENKDKITNPSLKDE